MSFTNIDHTRPLGSEKGNILDDSIKETRYWAKTVFGEISGFPDIVAIICPTWTTANRPTGSLKENLMGYNSEAKQLETVQSGAWTRLPLVATDADTVTSIRFTIGTTAPTSPVVDKEIWVDTTNELLKIYTSSGWRALGAVYK